MNRAEMLSIDPL